MASDPGRAPDHRRHRAVGLGSEPGVARERRRGRRAIAGGLRPVVLERLVERLRECGGRREPLPRILGQRGQHGLVDPGRDLGDELARSRGAWWVTWNAIAARESPVNTSRPVIA